MHLKQKYIKTKNKEIIVFSELLMHSDFAHFQPLSAGFISITSKVKKGEEHPVTECKCYGHSVSLRLIADENTDTLLANNQILGNGY